MRTYPKICEFCETLFEATGPAGRYCKPACRAEVLRERARVRYAEDTETHLTRQAIKKARRKERRWLRLLQVHGDECQDCRVTYPVVVYDLHHPNGKEAGEKNPSHIIAQGSEVLFQKMLSEVVVLCANCHRLRHEDEKSWAPRAERKFVGNCPVCGKAIVSSAPRPSKTCSEGCRAYYQAIREG